MTAVAAMAISTAAFAEEATVAPAATIAGGINLEVTENASGDYVAATTLNVGITAEGLAFGGASVESVDGATFELDEWFIGTHIGTATLSFGKQGDLMVGNDFEIVGGDTLADVADDHESLQVTVGAASVMVGFTDITADVTEVENVQGAYTLALGTVDVTAVGDYNLNSEEYVLGGKAALSLTDDIAVGGLLTYASATEAFGYEASAGYSFATAFVNGDDSDMLQNVGAGVAYDVHTNLNVYAEGAYNLDTEDTTVGAGVSFNF
jgi:hypothetical protein